MHCDDNDDSIDNSDDNGNDDYDDNDGDGESDRVMKCSQVSKEKCSLVLKKVIL